MTTEQAEELAALEARLRTVAYHVERCEQLRDQWQAQVDRYLTEENDLWQQRRALHRRIAAQERAEAALTQSLRETNQQKASGGND